MSWWNANNSICLKKFAILRLKSYGNFLAMFSILIDFPVLGSTSCLDPVNVYSSKTSPKTQCVTIIQKCLILYNLVSEASYVYILIDILIFAPKINIRICNNFQFSRQKSTLAMQHMFGAKIQIFSLIRVGWSFFPCLLTFEGVYALIFSHAHLLIWFGFVACKVIAKLATGVPQVNRRSCSSISRGCMQ